MPRTLLALQMRVNMPFARFLLEMEGEVQPQPRRPLLLTAAFLTLELGSPRLLPPLLVREERYFLPFHRL